MGLFQRIEKNNRYNWINNSIYLLGYMGGTKGLKHPNLLLRILLYPLYAAISTIVMTLMPITLILDLIDRVAIKVSDYIVNILEDEMAGKDVGVLKLLMAIAASFPIMAFETVYYFPLAVIRKIKDHRQTKKGGRMVRYGVNPLGTSSGVFVHCTSVDYPYFINTITREREKITPYKHINKHKFI